MSAGVILAVAGDELWVYLHHSVSGMSMDRVVRYHSRRTSRRSARVARYRLPLAKLTRHAHNELSHYSQTVVKRVTVTDIPLAILQAKLTIG